MYEKINHEEILSGYGGVLEVIDKFDNDA